MAHWWFKLPFRQLNRASLRDNDMCEVHVYNSLGMERRTACFKIMVEKVFAWLSVLYPFHPLMNKKDKGMEILSKAAPKQSNIIDCGLFLLGFVMHIIVSKNLFNLVFTQWDVTNLHRYIPENCDSTFSLKTFILTVLNVPAQYQKNPSKLPAGTFCKKKQSPRKRKQKITAPI